MRDCAFGSWDPDTGGRRVKELTDPVTQSLADTADDAVYFSRLDAAIRALAPAARAGFVSRSPLVIFSLYSLPRTAGHCFRMSRTWITEAPMR